MNYLYTDREGNTIGEQISIYDILDSEDECEDTEYSDEDDE